MSGVDETDVDWTASDVAGGGVAVGGVAGGPLAGGAVAVGGVAGGAVAVGDVAVGGHLNCLNLVYSLTNSTISTFSAIVTEIAHERNPIKWAHKINIFFLQYMN